MKIMVVNGPNLNLLGHREPGLYGVRSLEQINQKLTKLADELTLEITFTQSNYEGALIDAIQSLRWSSDGAILNAGGYTHTSVALRDAILAVEKPVVEVHLTNPGAREKFRRQNFLTGAVVGSIAGFGPQSYELALWWFYWQVHNVGTV